MCRGPWGILCRWGATMIEAERHDVLALQLLQSMKIEIR